MAFRAYRHKKWRYALLYETTGKNYKKTDRSLKKTFGMAMKEAKKHVKCDVKPRQMLGYHPECIEGLIYTKLLKSMVYETCNYHLSMIYREILGTYL